MKSICILGATGSIGNSTANVIVQHPKKFYAKTIVANQNAKVLADMAKSLNSQNVCIYDKSKAKELSALLQNTQCNIAIGGDEILDVISQSHDFTMSAIVGVAGLEPTAQAMKHSKSIGIANKESIVCAGDIINKISTQYGCKVIPVDSEHSAIFQVLDSNNTKALEKITLTASGGAFRDYSMEQMMDITPEQAIKHPNWSMGPKITVDSATLMNKGLEVIEASKLFNIPGDKIEVLIHRQSIVHSMVTYHDGSTLAQLGIPDMQTPIALAMSYPKRIAISQPKLDLTCGLTFSKPDHPRFPLLNIAKNALKAGQQTLIALNALNEIAVEKFLTHKIPFLEIAQFIEKSLSSCDTSANISTIEDVMELHHKIQNTYR